MAKLVFTIKGKPKTISLNSFLTIINNSFGILKDLDSAISLEPKGSLDWIIINVSMSSLAIGVESKPRDPIKDCGALVANKYLDGIRIINEEEITPPYFSDHCLNLLQRTAKALSKNGAEILQVSDPSNGKVAEFGEKVMETAKQLRQSKYESFGSVEGTLEMISIHNKPRFNVYHVITQHAVSCSLPEKLIKTVKDALGRRVVVSGIVTYNPKDQIRNVEVKELDIIAKKAELPTIDEFIGSDPDFTGDMSTEEYIRSIRDA